MANKKWYDNAVMVNRDPNWYGFTTREDGESVFSFYGGAITDIMLGVFEQTALVPNSSFMWRGEKFLQTVEDGHEVSYPQLGGLYRAYTECGVDGVEIFIDEMKKLGIRPWLTFRMNDTHFTENPTSFLRSDMFYEERDAGHLVGDRYGSFAKLFDYRHPRYRNAVLGYIKEMLDKYDMFGIELDFMREIVSLDYLGHPDESREVMLNFMRTVKAYTLEAAKRLGHDVKISVRICRDPDDAYIFGYDIKTMASEGLIDAVVVTAHYSCTDSAMPLRRWRELLGDDVALIGGIETNNVQGSVNSAENSKAYAAAFYAQGADGIYFNNHEYNRERNRAAWEINRESALIGRRDFIVTYQDCAVFKSEAYKPLPQRFVGTTAFRLEIGKVKPTDKVTLLLDFEGVKFTFAQIGNVRASEARVAEPLIAPKGNSTVSLTEHTPLELDLTGISTDGPAILELKGNGTVHFIRLTIESADNA